MKSVSDWPEKLRNGLKGLKRYKYAALVIVIGLALLLIPGKSADKERTAAVPPTYDDAAYVAEVEARLTQTLAQMQGAGEVRVMLLLKTGSETRYQTDISASSETADGRERTDREQKTVILSAGSAYDEAAVSAVEYPRFQGALVLCQGGSNPTVRLNCINAVRALTGLKSDQITVAKMK